MLKVSEVLRVKGNALFTINPDKSVQNGIEHMSQSDVGSLVVMEHGDVVGLVTFREVLQYLKNHPEGGDLHTVRSIMDDHPITVTPNTDANEVQRLMLEHSARYIPVMDGPTLLGVISFFDMARTVVENQKFENTMLKAYIRDWPAGEENS